MVECTLVACRLLMDDRVEWDVKCLRQPDHKAIEIVGEVGGGQAVWRSALEVSLCALSASEVEGC